MTQKEIIRLICKLSRREGRYKRSYARMHTMQHSNRFAIEKRKAAIEHIGREIHTLNQRL